MTLGSLRHPATLLTVLLLACSPEAETGSDVAAAVAAVPIGGRYEVRGTTSPVGGGASRDISGTVILNEQGDRYTATFELSTVFPGSEANLPTEVIGTGTGSIKGRTLTGNAETQLVTATVPGVDPGFAFIPRAVSTRIESSSTTEIAPDGAVVIEIKSRAAAGEDYIPTRTTLRGRRISAAGLGDK